MNTKFTLALAALAALFQSNSFASFSHTIQDPQKPWVYASGVIEESTISVKPQGTYTEYGVYLTFSAKGYYQQSVADTFEVQFYFDLPENAIITDSWLWVGNNIVQAKMYDRSRATTVYEGIVNRRKDPSILYKNSATTYELRVFPMAGNEVRKVKITYLLPSNLQQTGSFNSLPIEVVKNSSIVNKMNLLIYEDSIKGFTQPYIVESGSLANYDSTSNAYKITFNGFNLNQLSTLTVKYNSVINNQHFFSVQQEPGNSGFYQMAFQPKDFFNIQSNKKLLLLVDYASGNSSLTKEAVLDNLKSLLIQSAASGDSFNLILSNLTPYKASNNWLPLDTTTINMVFSATLSQQLSSYSNLQQLLVSGVNFMNQQGGGGNALLLSSESKIQSELNSSSLISDLVGTMVKRFPIHVLNYNNSNYSCYYFNGRYYSGNGYFLWNLSNATGGNYDQLYDQYCYSGTVKAFSTTLNSLYDNLQGSIRNINVNITTTGGVGFASYVLDNGNNGIGNSIKIVGRLVGDFPMDISVSGIVGSNLYYKTVTVNSLPYTDTMARKIWMGKYLSELEAISNNSNSGIREIMDSSIKYRILSLHTAFLALEPSDSTQVCSNCPDESSNFPSVGIEELNDSLKLKVKAYPNPFSAEITFEVNPDAAIQEIIITDLAGRKIKMISVDETTSNVKWNGTNDEGGTVTSGLYIVYVKTSIGNKTLRLSKM